jgi:hypothetical protein
MTWLICAQCGGRYINRGGHAETCPGPMQRIAPPKAPDPGSECGCNTGGFHESCVHVTGATGRETG